MMRWINVQEIYADGKHNCWPDICRWRGRYWVSFNSAGKGHSNGHRICLISSADGVEWVKEHETGPNEWAPSDDADRGGTCPKLLATDDRLYVMFNYYRKGEAEVADAEKQKFADRWRQLGGSDESFERWVRHHQTVHQSGITWTEDGRTFAPPQPMLDPGWRVWRPHTFAGRHYLIGYCCHGQAWSITPQLEQMIPTADDSEMFESASLFASDDGEQWQHVSHIAVDDNDEPDFDFTPDGRMLMVSRTGASMKRAAMAYLSDPPYETWQRLTLSDAVQSPAVRWVEDKWVLVGRGVVEGTQRPAHFAPDKEQDTFAATRLWLLDDQSGELSEQTTLPSWGDGAYPGIETSPQGDLFVVYYTCSQMIDENLRMGPGPLPGKYSPCSIYLARVVMV